MSTAADRELVFVVGCTGSGKTTLAEIKLGTTGPRERVLVMDKLGKKPTSLAQRFCDDIFDDPEKLRAALKQLQRGDSFRVAFVPRHGSEPAAAGWLARIAREIGNKIGPLWLVIEEASSALPDRKVDPEVIDIAQTGRHDGVSLMTLSQRMVGVDPDIRAELAAGETWIGRQAMFNDKEYVRQLKGPRVADRVDTLETIKDHGFARWLKITSGGVEDFKLHFVGGKPTLERIECPPTPLPLRPKDSSPIPASGSSPSSSTSASAPTSSGASTVAPPDGTRTSAPISGVESPSSKKSEPGSPAKSHRAANGKATRFGKREA